MIGGVVLIDKPKTVAGFVYIYPAFCVSRIEFRSLLKGYITGYLSMKGIVCRKGKR